MYEQITMNRRASLTLAAVLAAILLGLGFFIGCVWVRSAVGDLVVVGLSAGIAVVSAFFVRLSLCCLRLAAAAGSASSRRQSQTKDGGGTLFFLPAIVALILVAVLALWSALVARVARFLAGLVQLAISRRREYLADASAVELARDPLALADALARIAACGGAVRAARPATAHLYIANPFAQLAGSLDTLFDTHPPIERRIAILRAMVHQSPRAGEPRPATVPRQVS